MPTDTCGSGFSSHAIRFRVQNTFNNGFIYENSSGTLLSSLRANDGRAYFRGDVGIGTTGPQEKLDVVGNAEIGTSGEEMHIGNVGIVDGAGIAHKDRATSGDYALIQDVNGLTAINSDNVQPISFRRNNSEVGRFHLNGNFGIGVQNPIQRLHVAGNAFITGSYLDSDGDAGSVGQVLSSGGGSTNWITLPSTTTITDNQTLSISGNSLSISGGNTIILPGGGGGPSIVAAAKVNANGTTASATNVT